MLTTNPRIFKSEEHGNVLIVIISNSRIVINKGGTSVEPSHDVRITLLDKANAQIDVHLSSSLNEIEAFELFSELTIEDIEPAITVKNIANAAMKSAVSKAKAYVDFNKDKYYPYGVTSEGLHK